jgi:hypothetical protein
MTIIGVQREPSEMLGAILFLVFFLLIAPQTRGMITGMLGQSGDWISNYAPFSYIVLTLLAVAGIFSLQLMVSWPKTPEPENPLAKYKRDELADVD